MQQKGLEKNDSTSWELREKDLTMAREKRKSVLTSLAYRAARAGDAIFGKKRMLRLFLNGSWVFWRFAFERSGEIYGSEFHNQAKALSKDYLRRWVKQGDSIIDIGCGVGRWCRVAVRYGGSVVGIDFSQSYIDEARRTANGQAIEYIVGDVTHDLDGRRFDLALLIHAIEHIDEADEFLRKLTAVTKKLIVEVPDFESDPLNGIRLKMSCPFYSDGDHIREYTQSILNDQLMRNGWNVIENRKNGGAVLAVAERGAA